MRLNKWTDSVSNARAKADIMDLDIWPETGGVMLRLPGEPNHPHILEGSTDLTNWIPWLTNTSPNTVTDLLDTNAPALDRRFYRGVKP